MLINVPLPQTQTLIFSGIFLICLLIFLDKKRQSGFFSLSVSNQLKGLAILAIVFSHIGYFLSRDTQFLFPLSALAGVGVNLFLFLSGFGLTSSSLKKPVKILDFYKKRLERLYLPFWIVLAILIILDFALLNKTYPLTSLVENFLGFFPQANLYQNINSPLWYFSFILFYYLLFPLVFLKKGAFLSPFIALGITLWLLKLPLPITSGVWGLYNTHTLAFPLGMLFALLLKYLPHYSLPSFFKRCLPLPLIVLIYYFTINSGVGQGQDIEQTLSLINMFLIIFLFLILNWEFRLLSLVGVYSYEIYLLHWPILYRYDLLYKYLPAYMATTLYLGLFLILGLLLQKMTAKIHLVLNSSADNHKG